jgi:tetratricopeptide (TPR) repeat protein
MKRGNIILAAVVFVFCAAPNFAQQKAAQSSSAPSVSKANIAKPNTEQMRLTTKSEHARELFGQAIVLSGNYRLDECLKSLRTAVGEDATFAAGWSLLAYFATDAHEASDALAHAQSLVGKSSPSEMLFVRWVAAMKHNDQIAAISNLNDLTKRESGDKFVLYLAGRWFVDQRDQQKAVALFEKVLVLDPEFTPVLNRLGYAYAAMGEMAYAETLMQRYVAAMPTDPNPEDSYGDILFKAGRYNEAGAHFAAALKKDLSFGPSQHELGDVFAMLGNQDAAREAYHKSALLAANTRRSLEYRSSIALSYVRDNLYGFADREYSALVAEAKAQKYTDLQASFHEAMALYQTDDLAAMKHLDAAEDAIRNDEDLATVTRDEHMATIRRWRGVRSMHAGNPAMADVCIRVMEQKYESTENEFIGDQLHALRGAWFLEQKKFAQAIPELEQASDDAFSLVLLARAKRESGDAAGAEAALRQLLAIHSSTMDGVLVVEPLRQKSTVSAATSR